ncbi:hypothetical protein CEUSTIGMA_g12178.t1 [Chlamydomonas eustigma]|uniref:Uncharacterized protein n=1 Tax=Chlamydomonas eustigma TaxID=1157962 RepID=A0A250XNY8_9CHLO|nr:hypothetical protein CEUSTIGMA_g12178.t1 [Chlamydomonas eustigma]|eukprot:GAX84756.1 hypothetical protein CEUSTIGMA_g12178.t1 [Chlamydomonas eustigma]
MAVRRTDEHTPCSKNLQSKQINGAEVDCREIVCPAHHQNSKSFRLNDPGRINIYYMVGLYGGNPAVMKQYYTESGATSARYKTERWNRGIQTHLNALSSASTKGVSWTAHEWCLRTTSGGPVVLKPRWARLRLSLYGGKKRVFANFFNRLSVRLPFPAYKECASRVATYSTDEFEGALPRRFDTSTASGIRPQVFSSWPALQPGPEQVRQPRPQRRSQHPAVLGRSEAGYSLASHKGLYESEKILRAFNRHSFCSLDAVLEGLQRVHPKISSPTPQPLEAHEAQRVHPLQASQRQLFLHWEGWKRPRNDEMCSGHIDIIKGVLPDGYFDIPVHRPDFNLDLLLKGIQFVDAPCGSYGIRDDSVIFKKNKKHILCSTTSLVNLFYERTNGETELFQHHKGFFAHLHAMTTDPGNTVLKIRNKIITSVLGYCLLAARDANALFAGMVLHVITDSYSPAHTIREKTVPKRDCIVEKREDDPDRRMRLAVHEQLKTLAKEDYLYSKAELRRKLPTSAFTSRKHAMLWKAYLSFKFEYDLNKQVATFAPTNRGATGPERNGDIISFQYYENQPLLLHMKLDLLRYVKPELYSRMHDECLAFLTYYRQAVLSGDVNTFLKRVRKLLLQRTFRIHQRYLNDTTHWIVRW